LVKILQTGGQRTNGYELGINGNITRRGVSRVVMRIRMLFITSDTTAARAGAQVAQVPHQTFSLWNKYQILPRLGVGLGIIHRSDMFAAIDDKVTLPGYTPPRSKASFRTLAAFVINLSCGSFAMLLLQRR